MKEKDLAIMEQFRKCIPIFSVLNDAKRQEIILILTDFPGEGLNELTFQDRRFPIT